MSNTFQTLISSIGLTDILDILIVAFLVYKVLGFIKETRAEQLVKGLILLAVAFFVSDLLNLNTLNWILKSITAVGIIALVVVFQPELRRGLEYVGRSKLRSISSIGEEKANQVIQEFIEAIEYLSSTRTGALIVIERETALTDICETGTRINAEITDQIIGNIFYEGAPLHDGAVIIRGDRVYAAGCVLPLTENNTLDKELGTRHRAGIGITERSDAISIIVSEETGIVSTAVDGKITRYLDSKFIEKTLHDIYVESNKKKSFFDRLKGGKQDAK